MEEEYQISKTWKPTAAGILNVLSGAFFLIGGIIVISLLGQPRVAVPRARYAMYSMGLEGKPGSSFVTTFIILLGIAALVPGVASILGGIYSIKRKFWEIALAGSIPTFLSSIVLGIPTIALTAHHLS